MRNRLLYLFTGICIIVLVGICGFQAFKKPRITTQHDALPHLSNYYFPISVSKSETSNLPYISLNIEGMNLPTLLDLGFRGQVALSPENLLLISQKTYLNTTTMYGINGAAFDRPLYLLPKIELDPLVYSNVEVQEEIAQFHREATFTRNGMAPVSLTSSKIGWELFAISNLFLDLEHSMIAICDSLDTLGKEGYLIDTFAKVPLLLDRGLVEFEGTLCGQPIRFMLDTGASINVFNTPLQEGFSMESMIWEEENLLTASSVKAGEHDLGPMDFRRIPIKLPIPIGAILGMEFFEEHLVFLDFINGFLYIAKTPLPQPEH